MRARIAGAACSVICQALISGATGSSRMVVRINGGRFWYLSTARGVPVLRILAESGSGPSLLTLELPGLISPPTTITEKLLLCERQSKRSEMVRLRWADGHRRQASMTIWEAGTETRCTLEVGPVGNCAECMK